MLSSKKAKKVLSLFVTILMVLGSFTSFAYAEGNQLSSAKLDLREEALKKINPEVMIDLEDDDVVEVLVYMKEQVDTEMVAYATRNAVSSYMTPYSTKLEVRKGVVEALRDKAELTQASILNYLEQEKENGNVTEYKPYHIVNMLYVKGTKDVIENISYMAEVEKIYKNKTYQMDISVTGGSDVEPQGTEPEWNIIRVGADEAWNLGYDGTGIVVGSLDSGVDWTHPALKEHWRGYDPNTGATDPSKSWFDPVYGASLPADSDSHGTHVMGTIVGQEPDGSNPVGVAPGARWITARVFNTAGSTTDRILLDSAEWMLHPDGDPTAAPDVVNNSWGGLDGIDDWYREAVRAWRAAEIFPVFSAGNQRAGEPLPWPGSISCPANYPESFAVAAVNRYDERASFSKLGPSPYDPTAIKPNISAPGVNIYSSIPGGYTSGYSGTSMSAPHITGTVALLLSANASLTLEDIEEIITTTAEPLTDSTYPNAPNFGYGYGMVNAFEAVSSVATGTGYITGRVLIEGSDNELPEIYHEQTVTEAYAGSDIAITAEVSDDVSVRDVELLVKNKNSSYWMLVSMNRVAGDHKSGTYQGTIAYDLLVGDSITYKIKAKDFSGEVVTTRDYTIDIKFGIVPDEYSQGFEDNALGWIMEGAWGWGLATGSDPLPVEGINLAGTVLGGNYPTNAEDWMITPPIDLRDDSLSAASLRFNHWYNIENNYDKGYLYVTNDYGTNWTQVGLYTNTSNGWQEVVVDLNDYIGSSNPVFVGFRFTSDNSVVKEGWYIDNVRLMGPDKVPPAVPADFTAEPGLKGIKLSWTNVLEADLSHYNIYRAELSGGEYDKIGQTAVNSFVDTDVVAEETYYYVITASDTSGNESGYSAEASATAQETTIIFSEDFEENNGGFVKGVTSGTANDWEWGIPTSGPNTAASGEKLWATKLAGNYTASNNSYIESPAIVIPEDKNPVLTFNHWYDFEGTTTWYDYGKVMISSDNGATWINVTPGAKGQYGTRLQTWLTEEIPLGGYNGETIKIRFFFYSDSSVFYSGWYVDDVSVIGLNIPIDPPSDPVEDEETLEAKKADYVDPGKPNYSLRRFEVNSYEKILNNEVTNMPMGTIGVPAADAVVTILETGRSVKVDPVTGRFSIRVPMGEYTLSAEAYGYYSQEAEVAVIENGTVSTRFLLEPMPRGSITGRAYDRYYGEPASYASIRLVEDPKVVPVIADVDGYFTISDVIIGDYTIKVVADGFYPGEFLVTVDADAVTDVELELQRYVGIPSEIAYDDGTAENALVLNEAPNGLAVRFTPEENGKVVGANVYFWDTSWPTPGGNRMGFAIYDIAENGAVSRVEIPIFVNVQRGAWNYIDLSSYGFATNRDFYISTIQDAAGTSCPGTGIDQASPYADRSYLNIDGEFSPLADEDIAGGLMIRAIIEKSVGIPVITNLNATHYTNQDVITVKGTVETDCKVNVFVNGEIAASGNAENLEFAIDVELPLDENQIMVTAEYEDRQTEPSSAVTVIKDKVAPVLVVDEPLDNAKINAESVHVIGNVAEDTLLANLLINEKEALVNEDGSFHERLMLDEGENIITVKATDGAGNETIVTRTITVDLEAPEITNMMPDEDIELYTGQTLEVSFNAESGGEGYFRIVAGYTPEGSRGSGIPMIESEETPGLYEGSLIIPEGFSVNGGLVEFEFIDAAGNRIVDVAPGRVTIEELVLRKIQPASDVVLESGDTVEISFNSISGGEAFFRIMLPFGLQNVSQGMNMVEEAPGFYRAVWTAPAGIAASGLIVEVSLIKGSIELVEYAPGTITIVGQMSFLPSNTIIVGKEAFDIRFLENSEYAQEKLNQWQEEGNEVFIKLDEDTIVNADGELVDFNTVNMYLEDINTLLYYDRDGNTAIYR